MGCRQRRRKKPWHAEQAGVPRCGLYWGFRLSNFDRRLAALGPRVLSDLRRGIEKESLRVGPDGMLARTPHPPALGSALTHPHITTDFSESQLELITGVHTTADACLQQLT